MDTPDQVFSWVFALIVMLAAAPRASEFLQKVQKARVEGQLKLEMLNRGFSADEIVRSILSQCERELPSQRV